MAAKTNIAQAETLQQASTAISTSEVDNTQRLSVSHATLVNAITSAGLSRRYALQMELSSGLALFLAMGGVSNESKQALMNIYCESGYDAATPSGSDYKTCHRRRTASALLYDYIGPETVGEWCAGTAEMMSITAISKAIEPLKLTSIDAAMAYAGKPRKPALPSPTSKSNDNASAQEPRIQSPSPHVIEITTEAQYDSWLKKRGATPLLKPEAIEAGFRTVATEHLSLVIPPECGKDEIVKFAMSILAVAQEMEAPAQEEGAQEHDTHAEEPGDARGNIYPSAPKRTSAGNVAVPEVVAQDKDGNIATAKPSRYRAAPKKAREIA